MGTTTARRLVPAATRRWRACSHAAAVTDDTDRLDVANATAAAAAARAHPATDAPLAAGVPETAGRAAAVVADLKMRSGEPALSHPRVWRVIPGHARDELNRFREPLMGWTASAVPEASLAPDALEFSSACAAVAFAARQGWAPEVHSPPPLPRFNSASIPGAGLGPKPVPYAANFSVARGGVPRWPRDDVAPDEPPPYDVEGVSREDATTRD